MEEIDNLISNAEGRISVCRQDIKNSNDEIYNANLDIVRKEGMIEGILLMIDWVSRIGEE